MNENASAQTQLVKLSETVMAKSRAATLYARHLLSLLPWSNLDCEKQAEIRKVLDELIDESSAHLVMFEAVVSGIEDGDFDVLKG